MLYRSFIEILNECCMGKLYGWVGRFGIMCETWLGWATDYSRNNTGPELGAKWTFWAAYRNASLRLEWYFRYRKIICQLFETFRWQATPLVDNNVVKSRDWTRTALKPACLFYGDLHKANANTDGNLASLVRHVIYLICPLQHKGKHRAVLLGPHSNIVLSSLAMSDWPAG